MKEAISKENCETYLVMFPKRMKLIIVAFIWQRQATILISHDIWWIHNHRYTYVFGNYYSKGHEEVKTRTVGEES